MNALEDMPVGQIVAEDYRAAPILKSHRIDFCCQGGTSLAEACRKKEVDIWEVTKQLKALDDRDSGELDFRSWSADLLCDYIEKKHHRYLRHRVEEIPVFLDKVARVHGGNRPELIAIRDLFKEAAANLLQHLEKEENELFPAIRKSVEENKLSDTSFKEIVSMLREEHQQEGERFEKIAELSNNYQTPDPACNTYQVSYALLKEFEEDLHKHIHLENNILFAKIQELPLVHH